MTAKVEIYSPDNRTQPIEILRANFDPEQGHVQWIFRPAARPIQWGEITVPVPGEEEGARLVSDDQAAELAKKFPTFLDLAAGDPEKVKGIGKATATAIGEWAVREGAFLDATAELAAQLESADDDENDGSGDAAATEAEPPAG